MRGPRRQAGSALRPYVSSGLIGSNLSPAGKPGSALCYYVSSSNARDGFQEVCVCVCARAYVRMWVRCVRAGTHVGACVRMWGHEPQLTVGMHANPAPVGPVCVRMWVRLCVSAPACIGASVCM